MQSYIDTLTDQRDNRCGCLCLRCCFRDNPQICRDANSTNQCQNDIEECTQYNDDVCTLQYSDPEQAPFCEVRNPISWPALLDIPLESNRPGRWYPDVVVFTTAQNQSIQEQLTRRLFPQVELNQLGESLETTGEDFSASGGVLGSPVTTERFNYIEPGFVNGGLTFLSRDCQNEMTQNTLNFINNGLQSSLEEGSLMFNVQEGVSCANVHFSVNSSDEIDRYIFCNYEEVGTLDLIITPFLFQARCNITAEVFNVPYENSDTDSPDQYTQAMDFRDTNEMKLDADFWIKDWDFDEEEDDDGPQSQRRANQPINMIANAWLKFATNANSYSSLLLGIQETPKPATRLNLQLSSFVAVLLFTWVIQMLLPLMLVQLVYEKEEHLRIMMKMHGLHDGAYWLVNYTYYLLIYVLYVFIFVAAGSAAGFVIFTKNSYGVQLVFLLLFGNVQIAFTFVLSNFFRSSRGCVVFSFLWIFGTGFIGLFLLDTLYGRDKDYNYLIELIPAFAAYRGLYELGEYGFRASYSNSDGITWAKFDEDNNHMGYIMIVFLIEWPLFLFLAWYLEQVFVTGSGVARHPLFFLDYFKKPKQREAVGELELIAKSFKGEVAAPSRSSEKVVSIGLEDETIDEAAERRRVESFSNEEAAAHSIIINKLRKVFPAYDGTPEKVAVKGLTMAVRKGEVFGLLGPNGAGKTTTINMLIGFMNSTSGTAFVEGYDIGTDMETLYGLMGVCPQHNLLWETLTGYEHLLFYGRLKGLKDDELRESAKNALKGVNLFHGGVAEKLVKKFSGGMKRRLSVAISLIGNPLVVYLDEPSTGLDPASRRNLWKVIKSAKQNKAIILTTHNMEEAEELCDRLGIFVDGKLQVIGNPKSLTARYGGYLVFTLITIPGQVSLAAELVQKAFPSSQQTYVVAGTLKFELPSQTVSPSSVFQFVDDISGKIKVLDWGVATVSLEEVFIKIAKDAGAKSNLRSMDIPPNQTIYINNLYEKITQETLRSSLHAMFSQFGPILDIVTGQSIKKRGQAFVVFNSVSHATNALRSMQGFPFFEKPLRIQYAKSKSDAVAKLDGTFKERPKRPRVEQTPAEKRSKQSGRGTGSSQKNQGGPSQQSVPNRILFIQNLPENTNDMMLSMLFKQFPGILRFVEVRMIESRPGIAFVEYENEHMSAVAIQGLQGFKIGPEHFMNITYANK
eukprot:g3473.t1